MQELQLGPNGGMLYCLEYLVENLDWLHEKLAPLVDAGKYIVFDFPGQVELFTHHNAVLEIISQLTKRDFRLCSVHLVDSQYIGDAAKYMSVLLVTLTTMLKLGLPHVNVLSKIDLVEQLGKLDFNLDYFTDVLDLSYLCDSLDRSMSKQAGTGRQTNPLLGKKYVKLNRAMAELVEDFNLVPCRCSNSPSLSFSVCRTRAQFFDRSYWDLPTFLLRARMA